MKNYSFPKGLQLFALLMFLFSCQKEPEQNIEIQEESNLKEVAGSIKGYKDGSALEAQFENPLLIAVGPDKSIFIVEGTSYIAPIITGGFRIRKISTGGIVSTFFDTQSSNQGVSDIRGIVVDKNGFVVISDGNQIKRISSDGKQVSVIAGDGTMTEMKDGPALSATFWQPGGLAYDGNGCLYIMDTANNAVRMLSNGKVTTIAGGNREFDTDAEGHFGPRDGTGRAAEFDRPQFITLDDEGNIYVSGGLFRIVRKITREGVVTRLIGGNNLEYESEALDTFRGITFSANHLYMNLNYGRPVRGNYFFFVSGSSLPDLNFTQLAADDYSVGIWEEPLFPEGGLNFPTGMVVIDNFLYFCNTGEHKIRKIQLD